MHLIKYIITIFLILTVNVCYKILIMIFFKKKGTSIELPEVMERASAESIIEDTTEDYWAGSGAGPEDDLQINRTETRESLTHEASDQDTVSFS